RVIRVDTRILDDPPPEWSVLVAEDRNATPAHRPELWTAWCRTMPGMRRCFVSVEAQGGMIGGAGFLLERRAGFHWIRALPLALSGAPLARAGSHAIVEGACAEAMARLLRERRGAGGEWSLYRPAGPGVEVAAIDRLPGETRVVETSIIPLGDDFRSAW